MKHDLIHMPNGLLARREDGVDLPRIIGILKKSLASNDHGAIVTFTGVVRGKTVGDSTVDRLEYEVYEEAARESIQGIAEALAAIDGVKDAVICHKHGTFRPGEEVLYVAIATDHSGVAFDALKLAVGRIKHELPIWKKEHSSDGSYWVSI